MFGDVLLAGPKDIGEVLDRRLPALVEPIDQLDSKWLRERAEPRGQELDERVSERTP